ncbi:hypothetical protein BDW60DRAFT_209377 [Aspergillus nidulans var. acristatus]
MPTIACHDEMYTDGTPDTAYRWDDQEETLKEPTSIDGSGLTNAELIQRNPESYVFFSMGYWYFQQTKWSGGNNAKRWSFELGLSLDVQIL